MALLPQGPYAAECYLQHTQPRISWIVLTSLALFVTVSVIVKSPPRYLRYLKSLFRFHALYMDHRLRAQALSLPFKSGVLEWLVPSDEVNFNRAVEMIEEHHKKLIESAKDQQRNYAC